MIVVVDYNMGNTGSILNMIMKVGGKANVFSDPEQIDRAEKLVSPRYEDKKIDCSQR